MRGGEVRGGEGRGGYVMGSRLLVCNGADLGTPASLLGGPADLSLADAAADPVTAVLLLHHNQALGAGHRISISHQFL